ncbi:aldehyde ferredoxin oxidoreductase [Halorubraceae archaeon YAN]|nr:aldehyde ferredoxin oxidoreductase [Halorubraceae archaeon YAN]
MTNRSRDHLLTVDLSTKSVERWKIPNRWCREYIGGKGLGARYLYEALSPGTDPLGPANAIGFVVGPLSGYLPGQSRFAVITKSPLTGAFLDSYSGGSFADRLAGSLDDCLGMFVTGQADHPVQIAVSGGTATIEPAETWGMDTANTDSNAPAAATTCIGPAGENQVMYATIAADGGDHHAGRGGAGAVMGSKQLKAVLALDGPPEIPPNVAPLKEALLETYESHDTGTWHASGGTMESIDFANTVGHLATEGWQRDRFADVADLGIAAVQTAAKTREQTETETELPGDFYFETDDGGVVLRGAAPMTLGAGLGIYELETVTALGEQCDLLGVDVIDTGNAVAWAIRAAEEGVIETDLSFGDATGASELIDAIATRDRSPNPRWPDNLPTTLADGIDAAANAYGGNDLIPTVKSMALPSYDPRGAAGMALAYATSDRGACHRRARPIETEALAAETWSVAKTIEFVIGAQTVRSVLWSLVIDDFVGEALWETLGSDWLSAIGYDYTQPDLLEVGERIWTLVRLFNAREGFDRADDRLPPILTSPANDATPERIVDPERFGLLLDGYYAARGWDADGIPTADTIARLTLSDVIASM